MEERSKEQKGIFMSENITWSNSSVTPEMRAGTFLRKKGCTIWLTGLPSSGKTTIAFALEEKLTKSKYSAYVLDGDNLRHGLNRDLDFSENSRVENTRRVGEVSLLLSKIGVITIVSLISPYKRQRDTVRHFHIGERIPFVEVFINTPIEICEERDSKGLYAKARKGEIKDFTGIDAPYERPLYPELEFDTSRDSLEKIINTIYWKVESHPYMNPAMVTG